MGESSLGVHVESRVALLADLHGNLTAFEAVLAEVDAMGIKRIVIAGDIAWGVQPAETVAAVMALGERAVAIRGNADREVSVPETVEGDAFLRESTEWCAAQLDDAQRSWLRTLPETATVTVDEVSDVLICHGSPSSDTEGLQPDVATDEVRIWLGRAKERVIVCGHTHVQFDRTVDGQRIVNPGSVGLHYGVEGAQWALLGSGVELRTTPYDGERAALLALASGIPAAEDFARFFRDPLA